MQCGTRTSIVFIYSWFTHFQRLHTFTIKSIGSPSTTHQPTGSYISNQIPLAPCVVLQSKLYDEVFIYLWFHTVSTFSYPHNWVHWVAQYHPTAHRFHTSLINSHLTLATFYVRNYTTPHYKRHAPDLIYPR